jgi:hypothetical protein
MLRLAFDSVAERLTDYTCVQLLAARQINAVHN